LSSQRLATVVAQRLGSGALTLLVVTVALFGALHLLPGSYANVVLGQHYTPAAAARLNREYGLSQSVVTQYIDWLRHALTGNLGSSLVTGQSVTGQLIGRMGVTFELALMAVIFVLVIGVPLGFVAGFAARGARSGGASRLLCATGMGLPDFVIGSFFVYFFSKYSLGLTIGNYVPIGTDLLANLRSMVLPAFTLAVFGIALVGRTTRDAVAREMASPHVVAAQSRGIAPRQIARRHVARNVLVPVLTVFATYTAYLFGGDVVVESLYSLPGIGQYLLNAINDRDYPVVAGAVLFAAAVFITINTLVDVAYAVIDPRLGAAEAQ
jgi:peptide/nickel transport system permease protein